MRFHASGTEQRMLKLPIAQRPDLRTASFVEVTLREKQIQDETSEHVNASLLTTMQKDVFVMAARVFERVAEKAETPCVEAPTWQFTLFVNRGPQLRHRSAVPGEPG